MLDDLVRDWGEGRSGEGFTLEPGKQATVSMKTTSKGAGKSMIQRVQG